LNKIGEVFLIKSAKLRKSEVIKKIKDAEILLISPSGLSPIEKNLLLSMKRLRHIALLSGGYDWVDVNAAREQGTSVSNCAGANAESVAEHTWGMILDLAKRVTEFDRDVRNKGAYKFSNYEGVEIYGKTLGILGTGHVGSKVARIGRAFNVHILGFSKPRKCIIEFDRIVDSSTLFRESDIISVNLPLGPETRDFIDEKAIIKMKKGVIIVNTAREEIANKEAILKGIQNGRIRGYGLETEAMKPLVKDDPYLRYPNIIINPHNAFNTKEAKLRMKEMAISNIESFAAGKPKNIIN